MVNPLLIGNAVTSGISTFRKYRSKLREDPLTPEINRLKKERGKWTFAIDLIGRENPPIGEICYEVGEDAITSLSALEMVVLPCAMHNLLIPNKAYFYTDPRIIREISKEDSPLFKKIYPKPEKAIYSIGKSIEKYIFPTEESECIEHFKEKREAIVEALASSLRKIKAPYEPGLDYSAIKNELFENVKKMKGIEYDYFLNLQELSLKRNIKRAKIGVAAALTFAVGVLIGSKLKKAKALSSIV